MSNVKFNYFLKNNPNNKRELPIVMTIIMSGERTQMFTGLWTVKSKWNQKYSKVIGTDPDSKSINDTLLSFISRGRRVVNELVVSGKPFNPNTVKDKLKNGFSKNLKTIESYNLFLEKMEKKIPTKYTRSTYVKYLNTKLRVEEFIKHYTKRNDIFLYELDSEFMENFDLWLRDKYKVAHNTVYKTYQRFTRFIRLEVSNGNLDRYPFSNYSIKMIQKQGHYLSFEDIEKLENLNVDLPRLYHVKHLFLFSVYTGLAYADMNKLSKNDLYTDDEGMMWIKTTRQKSKSRVSIPLISNALKSLNILTNGDFQIQKGKLLPMKSNVRLNYEIKQICSMSRIKDYEKVTWHSARRSTSSIMMKAGIPLQILQKVLSHKSLSTSLMYYTHVEDSHVKEGMKLLDEKLNQRVEIPKDGPIDLNTLQNLLKNSLN
ncbi:Site-specific recombinase XerD [Tenacibaculum sp. MAR_2010_89]|uniref:site-specific integrase n=1 Tax=Tenacibaculum sp. MAR_2010_89 TaxID=1250198 RepID=UPI00089D32FE|nr:site-specific integrase [Tenacibaculum sp. MAR_2010_89]SED60555.1 Site-specific recombinase XerD [Tenacibaculum sp. MAR_2010_89]